MRMYSVLPLSISRLGLVSALSLALVAGWSSVGTIVYADSRGSAESSAKSTTDGIPLSSAERVSVRVPEFPVLSGEYRINDDDTISFPIVGRLKVTGRTPVDLERIVAEEVRRRAGREAQVTLEVIEYKPIFVNGYVVRAGAMPWRPGYTVMHAEALAGGVFRPTDSRSALPAENERARASRAAADLARVQASLARLQAEKSGEPVVQMPSGLTELVTPVEARKLVAAQNTMLGSRRAAFDARIKSLERGRGLGEEEIKALHAQVVRLDEQLKLRHEFAKSVKALNIKGLVRFERTLDEQSRIAELEERRTNVIVALARVHSSVSSVLRELDVINQERTASLDEEILRLERDAAQHQIDVDSARDAYRKLTGQNVLTDNQQRVSSNLSYEIVRNDKGAVNTFPALPLTPLLPGDLLVVRLQEQPSQ